MRFLIASMMLASLIVMSTGCICGPGGYGAYGPGYVGGCGEIAGCDSCGSGGCEPTCGFNGGYEPACGFDGGCGDPGCGCGGPVCDPCCINPCAVVCGLFRSIGSCIFGCGGCNSGCGTLYVDEWASCPPACCDPCNSCGDYVGGGGCGCGGGCDGGSCGPVGPACGRGLASIWGFRYMGTSCGGGGCGCSAGSCGSYGSSGGCGCQGHSVEVGYSHGGYSNGEIIHEQGPSLHPQILPQQNVPHAVEPPAETLPKPKPSQANARRTPAHLVRGSQATRVSQVRR
ncbi:hypothetical protein Poly24_15100 [Rosistilla carotiformis]|uniref:Stigma-specific protein, Stig1 n=1 Tax=Rosistilla carotiformis TaxID=2528017 RepID=A0A518JQI6_9BACT|nr:hypothetical protein [Rosistilla carotiformis]QDV67806.1 hypothetical protein Poly24_15100 [Rosistilla carotiformis]